MKAMLNPDRLTGKRVNHVVFGRGRILHVQDGYMHVSFGGVERMFEYPAAFSQYMTIEDKRLRPLLPECVPAQRTPAPARPVRRKTEGFVRDEYRGRGFGGVFWGGWGPGAAGQITFLS